MSGWGPILLYPIHNYIIKSFKLLKIKDQNLKKNTIIPSSGLFLKQFKKKMNFKYSLNIFLKCKKQNKLK